MRRLSILTGAAILALTGCATPLSIQRPADACAPTAQFDFVCGANKPEDLAHIPDTPWIVASGFATGAGVCAMAGTVAARARTRRKARRVNSLIPDQRENVAGSATQASG